MEHERGLVILSLDGGGIRGLSSLLILQELMTRLQRQLGLDKRPEIYEHFDIVGGTGTGGISAVMLGRLRIPLSRAIDHFAKLGEDVFSDNSFFSTSNTDRSRKMQRALKSIIHEVTGDENEKMMDNQSNVERCNTVVFAMARHNMNAGLPRAFRSYQGWENQMPDYSIWEVLCATTAYPDLFDSVNIGEAPLKQPFVGGCLGCNNPLPHILAEVKLMYPDRHVSCVISVGAGHARTIRFPTPSSLGSFVPTNVIETMKAIATDSEGDAQQMAIRFVGTQDLYFRLNVDQGMQSVELDNWERMGEVVAHTQGYMQLAEVTKSINASVEAIKNKNRVVPTQYIDGQLHITMNQPREEQIDTLLDRLSPSKDARYNSALSATMTKRRACSANTRTEVLTNAHIWTQDDKGAKIYWMNGMAGTGKTTIAYSLCKGLEENKQLGASFFCSRDSPTCRNVAKLVPTIAYQLGRFSDSYRPVVCSVLGKHPDVGDIDIETQFENLIAKPLREVKKAMPRNVVVVIDALDECADVDGTKKVLDLLFRHATELPLRFFVTSRPEPSIVAKITQRGSASRSILHLHDIERSLVQADIRTYLTEALAPIHPSTEQVELLTTRAGCLFIFAATVVRYISPDDESANHTQRLSAILGTTPMLSDWAFNAIDELYKMILSEVLEEGNSTVHETRLRRMVLWTVVCACEPLTTSGLAEVLGVQNEKELELAVKPLRSVLHLSDSTGVVSILHASFPDFLLNKKRAGSSLCCPEAEHNTYLGTRCFEVMKRSLRFNICGLETSFRFDLDVPSIQNRVENAISMGLFYACRYWIDHLLGAATLNILVPHLDEFLRHRLMFWMEVLNLKGWIGHGEGILSQVLSWLLTDNTLTELQQLTYDARNFVTTFAANPTSLSTPHIYLSVLPFTSTQSHVRMNYWPRTRGLLRVEGSRMEDRGRAALATWKVGSRVTSIAQSGDGKRIVSGCRDGTVNIWDISKGVRIVGPLQSGEGGGRERRIPFPSDLHVAFSHDGACIASSSQDGPIRIWDAHNGKPITDIITGRIGTVRSVAFSPDGTRLISDFQDCTIRMWDTHNGNPVGNIFPGHKNTVLSVAFSPDGKRIASGSSDCTIRIWDLHSATAIVGPLEGHTDFVRSVAFSPDGLRVVSGSNDKTVRVWDVQSGTILADPFRGHINSVISVAFSPDGVQVVSGSRDETIRIWNAQNGASIALLEGHRGTVTSVLFSSDSTRILSGSSDGTICIWDARHGATAAAGESSGHTSAIYSVAFSPDGTHAVSASADRMICVWDSGNGRLVVGPLKFHADDVNSVAFSPDGSQIVSGSADRTIRTWDARSGACLEAGSPFQLLLPSSIWHSIPFIGVPFKGHTGPIQSVAYSPDGCRIASSGSRTIRVWNSQTGKLLAGPFMGHTELVKSVAWSPDGTRIVSGSRDETVRMWLAHDGTSLWMSRAHSVAVYCVAYSPDGTRVVSGSFDRTILVLNAIDGTVLHGPFKGHADSVSSVAFSPDGTRIVSGSFDFTVRVWDAQKGTLVSGPFKGHTGCVRCVAFSPDGRRVVSCSDDKTIQFWEVSTADSPHPVYFDQCTLRDDGWMTHSDSQLLAWLPPDLRTGFPLFPRSGIIRPAGAIFADYHDLLAGERWKKCYRDSANRTMA